MHLSNLPWATAVAKSAWFVTHTTTQTPAFRTTVTAGNAAPRCWQKNPRFGSLMTDGVKVQQGALNAHAQKWGLQSCGHGSWVGPLLKTF